MKVGTDGVLVGAWAGVRPSDRRVLDIGTGTGLIALMLAQRAPEAHVTGIDIADVAQARENADASPWGARLAFVRCDIRTFAPDSRFDLIVSNPPFFVDSLTCPDAARTTARHTVSLTFEGLRDAVVRLLAPDGRFALILPTAEAARFEELCRDALSLRRRTAVRTTPRRAPKRMLLEFSLAPACDLPEPVFKPSVVPLWTTASGLSAPSKPASIPAAPTEPTSIPVAATQLSAPSEPASIPAPAIKLSAPSEPASIPVAATQLSTATEPASIPAPATGLMAPSEPASGFTAPTEPTSIPATAIKLSAPSEPASIPAPASGFMAPTEPTSIPVAATQLSAPSEPASIPAPAIKLSAPSEPASIPAPILAPVCSELVIGTGEHETYTAEYRALTRDFYLKF